MNVSRRRRLAGVAGLLACAFALQPAARAQGACWRLDADGGITWNVEQGKAHQDHVEMSGRRVSVIVTYGVGEKGKLLLSRHVVFPMLRFAPNKTRDHLALVFADDAAPRFFVNRAAPRNEVVTSVRHLGVVSIESVMGREREVSLT